MLGFTVLGFKGCVTLAKQSGLETLCSEIRLHAIRALQSIYPPLYGTDGPENSAAEIIGLAHSFGPNRQMPCFKLISSTGNGAMMTIISKFCTRPFHEARSLKMGPSLTRTFTRNRTLIFDQSEAAVYHRKRTVGRTLSSSEAIYPFRVLPSATLYSHQNKTCSSIMARRSCHSKVRDSEDTPAPVDNGKTNSFNRHRRGSQTNPVETNRGLNDGFKVGPICPGRLRNSPNRSNGSVVPLPRNTRRSIYNEISPTVSASFLTNSARRRPSVRSRFRSVKESILSCPRMQLPIFTTTTSKQQQQQQQQQQNKNNNNNNSNNNSSSNNNNNYNINHYNNNRFKNNNNNCNTINPLTTTYSRTTTTALATSAAQTLAQGQLQ
ncbi:unnamed protein product [Nesidiocoris tenuis]|uniref:Uncharacterized protein n=1 Tax=Nesidiocoris tenuis TaxID=355587 RepID=A0A6H5HA56_9HEMI|nr:unnamed protein product [Nesidiocoris tenuis]